jgi:hypothetical protein
MSQLSIAQIACLKPHNLDPTEVPGALQSDEQALDLVKLDPIIGKSGDMVRERIAMPPDIGYVVLLGQLPNSDCGGTVRLHGHGFSSSQYSIQSGENPLKSLKAPTNQ